MLKYLNWNNFANFIAKTFKLLTITTNIGMSKFYQIKPRKENLPQNIKFTTKVITIC